MAEAILLNNISYKSSQVENHGSFNNDLFVYDNRLIRYLDATNRLRVGYGTQSQQFLTNSTVSRIINYEFAFTEAYSLRIENCCKFDKGCFYQAAEYLSFIYAYSNSSIIAEDGYISDYAFYSCSYLIYFSTLNAKYRWIGKKAFYSCLRLVYVGSFLSYTSYIARNAFAYCNNIQDGLSFYEDVYIDDMAFISASPKGLFGSKIKYIGKKAFAYDYGLQMGVILSNSESCPIYIDEYAFYSTQYFYQLSMNYVSYIGKFAFASCYNLAAASINHISYLNDCTFLSCSNLRTVIVSGCSEIGDQVFKSCYGLQTVIMSDLSYIRSYAFHSCYTLMNISFPNASYIDHFAFSDCSRLSAIYPPTFPVCESIKDTSFNKCNSLRWIYFPMLKSIPSYTFCNKTRFNMSEIETAVFDECSYIGDGNFANCESLVNINFPKVKHIGNMVLMSTGIKQAIFPECEIIDDNAFFFCSSLEKMVFPKVSYFSGYFISVAPKWLEFNILKSFSSNFSQGGYMFQNLETLITPEMSIISSGYYISCSLLETIKIDNCKVIENEAFKDCISLKSLYLLSTIVTDLYSTDSFDGCFSDIEAYIYVNSLTYNSYINHSIWSNYSSLFSIYEE